MPKKYKIVYDRNACIGAAACAAVAPEFWKMCEDGKADLIGYTEEDGKQVLVVSEDEMTDKMKNVLALNKEAAEVCPVLAIRIFDEDGTQII